MNRVKKAINLTVCFALHTKINSRWIGTVTVKENTVMLLKA